ncbi:MAG: hypothetical protein H6563_13480 [Lewinellaceae bacterium]|nr:hypothetical protein [Lewinellaceae bacterium]
MPKVASSVRIKVQQMEPGTLFGYERFTRLDGNEVTIAKALSRLSKEGAIKRVAKGKYLKPRKSVFGESRPNEAQILKMLTEKNGKKTGYLTGTALFNQMGLTTQMPRVLVIATKKPLPLRKIEGYSFKFVKSEAPITESNIPFLQLLDAFRSARSIPGTGPDEVVTQLIQKVRVLSPGERNRLAELAVFYPPSTRALVGATLEKHFQDSTNAKSLFKTLNPLSTYKIGISDALLPNKAKWRIK